MLRHCVHHATNGVAAIEKRRRSSNDFQPVGRWRKAWSSHKKRRFKAIAGRTLIQAGYAKDDHW